MLPARGAKRMGKTRFPLVLCALLLAMALLVGIMTFTDLAGMVHKGPLFSGMQKVRDHDIR